MAGKLISYKGLLSNGNFTLFLLSQGVSMLGDAFQFIAITALTVNLTGTGLSAGLGIVMAPVIYILVSPLAGSLGDRFNAKYLLIGLDILRGLGVILFFSNFNIYAIYLLQLVLLVLDIIYNPPRRKLIVSIVKNEEILEANSIFSGISGAVFLIGPVTAGAIIGIWGENCAFFINSVSFFASALFLLFVSYRKVCMPGEYRKRFSVIADFKDGYGYLKGSRDIKEIIIVCTILSVTSASVNLAFYPYAFDVIKISQKQWSLMMSVFYGTNILAMVISMVLGRLLNRHMMKTVCMSFFMVAAAWYMYGMTFDLDRVIVWQFVEGTFAAVGFIYLGAKIQMISSREFIARVISFNDLVNNIGKLVTLGLTLLIMLKFPPGTVFFINAAVLSSYTLYKVFSGIRN